MNEILLAEKDFGVHEECGIFGVTSPEKAPLAREVYYGLFALQHRGQESAGIAVNMPDRRSPTTRTWDWSMRSSPTRSWSFCPTPTSR